MIPLAVQQRLPATIVRGLELRPITGADVRARSSGAVTRSVWATSDPELRRGSLFCPVIFGKGHEDPTPAVERTRVDSTVDTFVAQAGTQFGHVELPVPVPNPLDPAHTLDAIAVLPPALRPLIYLHPARYSASNLNDLYERVIEVAARLGRMRQLDAGSGHRLAGELGHAVEQLFVNGAAEPARTPTGRPMASLVDHLRIVGRSGVKSLLWALGFDASWAGG